MAIVAIDWDHTLMNGTEWLPGAQDALKQLRELGHTIVIHSCNNPSWIKRNLFEAGIVVDEIWDSKGKPVAHAYIDDRGIRFNGDWINELPSLLERLEE